MKNKSASKKTGNEGETRACEYLMSKGYEIIQRNYRTKTGELDIIARSFQTVVFVEVKTLPNATADMLSNVLGKEKQKRIIKTAKHFLLNHREYINSYLRFDVIILDMQNLPPVYHIENAFIELGF